MRQYHTTVKETKEIDKIICNRCGRSIPVIQGVPREDVYPDAEENQKQADRQDICLTALDKR